MHGEVLKKMQLKATEIVYLSKNIQFLQNAMEFLGGTIWITDRTINYEEASNAPDVIVKSIDVLQRFLSNGGEGFYGEVLVFPEKNKRGVIVPVKFQVDDMIFPLYMLGRYFDDAFQYIKDNMRYCLINCIMKMRTYCSIWIKR